MTDENVKYRIGANIASCRKRCGLTQAGLAEKLNYSDKAVSKWERGESIPDVVTLMQLAELFEISVGDLLAESEDLPGDMAEPETSGRRVNKNVILALSSTLVWFVALLAFVVLSSFPGLSAFSALPFVYAVPVNAIVALSLLSAWRRFRWNQLLISAIVWGSLLSLYVTVLAVFHYNFWKVFLLGIPGQIAVFLWFRLFCKTIEEETIDG